MLTTDIESSKIRKVVSINSGYRNNKYTKALLEGKVLATRRAYADLNPFRAGWPTPRKLSAYLGQKHVEMLNLEEGQT